MGWRIFLVLLVGSGCGRPALESRVAERVVMDHLGAVAPLAVVPDSLHLDIRQIEAGEEGHAVRLRAVWAFADTGGVTVDTSRVMIALISPANGGWRVVSYDSAMVRFLTALVDEDLRRVYDDLLGAAHHVYHVMTEHGWYYNEGGIPVAEVERLMAEAGEHLDHLGMRWGLTPIADTSTAQVVWAEDANGAQCALPITAGAQAPPGFDWVRDREFFTCRGRTETVYSLATLPDTIAARVTRDGVLKPR